MIFFTGDINLTDWYFNVGFGIGTKISKGFNPFVFLSRNDKDIWVGNFEGVASSVTTNKGLYRDAFRIVPKALMHLRHMDYYGYANNHAMEHGEDAYNETVLTLESYGCKVFGPKSKKSCILEHQGRPVSITGLCERIEESDNIPLYWHNPEYDEIEEEIESLPKDAFKVLFVHWGNEYINRPSSSQKKFAHWLIDTGFDLIIGMHPHVLQGYEEYKGKRIYYSLGNFVFDMPSEPCKIGAIVEMEFKNGQPFYSEKYIKIDNDCCPHIVEQSMIPNQWQFGYLNKCLKKEDNSENYHQEIRRGYNVYRKANHLQLIKSAIRHPFAFLAVLGDFINRRF